MPVREQRLLTRHTMRPTLRIAKDLTGLVVIGLERILKTKSIAMQNFSRMMQKGI
jgi:hypothetical protein